MQIRGKNFKIEKTTFLDELGNFKHFEPYFIFWPHLIPLTPIWTLLGAPFSKDAPFYQHSMSSCTQMKSLTTQRFNKKRLENLGAHGGLIGGQGGPWTHFSTDFQNIDYFWNQQAIPVLLGSLVLFKLALEMKNNWFCIFVQNLGLSQKITLFLISQ